MGIDDPDIERVIQWGVKHLDNLDTMIQHFRHAARNRVIQGIYILFTEPIFIGPRTRTKEGKKGKRTPEKQRGDLEDGLYKFINTTKCRRKVFLGYYTDADYHVQSKDLSTGPCCDYCRYRDGRLAPILYPVS